MKPVVLALQVHRLDMGDRVPQEGYLSGTFFCKINVFSEKFCKFLAGSFSVVSKRNFASKYAFDISFQDLQDVHTSARLQTQHFSKTV